jgi:3' terminal RNA ribose 2'-O-methyltransferase Hen1
MFLSISTTHTPATDLGYLLHKNPGRHQELALAFGTAHLFYSEASEERCTFNLVLDVDPVALVRGNGGADGGLLDQYVNDRPYAASSFLSVAIAKTLRTALNGRSDERQSLADTPIPLEAVVTPLPVRGDIALVRELFEPLGYAIKIEPIPLDPNWPEWGSSTYVTLRLGAVCRIVDLLSHLYVLIPVLDLKKHYYIDGEEIEKLLTKGGDWLAAHPARELIARRYLRRRRSLANQAIARLAEADQISAETEEAAVLDEETSGPDPDGVVETRKNVAEEELEKPLRLHEQRLIAVTEVLKASGARRVLDLGCGSGKLLKKLMVEQQFIEIVGVDVGIRDLEAAARRLKLERLSERQRNRIKLLQGALTYRDDRIAGYDAAALVEVIEHIDPDRLSAVEQVVFGCAEPELVVLTTPNREYNAMFESMEPGQLRHADHRFEWTRSEFRDWVEGVTSRFPYTSRIELLGEVDAELGPPSQMAIFERRSS